jgi:tRNA(Ile)-lysidine synthase
VHRFCAKVRTAIRRQGLLVAGQHVLVAVSGGADSVALLAALKELAPSWRLRLTVAHLHHGIRGAAASADAAFVRALAARLRVRFIEGRADVPALARRKRLSLEMAAREARYRFLARAARAAGVDAVATAHTADDQAETVLLKLARGSGRHGLGGMSHAGRMFGLPLVRPMLDATREEVLAFLRHQRLAWREDESNRDIRFLRNRVRHEIVPFLESRLNPGLRRALARTAAIFREEDAWMRDVAGNVLADAEAEGGIRIAVLTKHPVALQRRAVLLWLSRADVPAERLDFDAVDRTLNLARSRRASAETPVAGRWIVRKQYGRLTMAKGETPARRLPFRRRVAVPGKAVLRGCGLRVKATVAPGLDKPPRSRAGCLPARASLNVAALRGRAVYVRSWRPGDRMKPLGMEGSRKIQDILVDQKVPAGERASVPLFECADEIVWLPGYTIARGWEVKDPAMPALHLTIERIPRR